METALKICNRIIEFAFYALFLLVPLFFTGNNYELFEFNKLWLTFALTLIIAGAWFAKMILQKRIVIQRTPIDLPILLFLLSQIISTIFSLDTHVSIWGYYSRFNGGLLSIFSYIFLYYAFVSNFTFEQVRGDTSGRAPDSAHGVRSNARLAGALAGGKDVAGPQTLDAITMVKRLLKTSLIAGLIVALWGLPSHFGYDPTCFIFRGSLDVSCWTDAFQPKIRMFSTLGQPDWLAAYLAILIPLSIAYFLKSLKTETQNANFKLQISSLSSVFYFLLSLLFYLDLLYTGARSGFIAVGAAIILFFALYFYSEKEKIINLRSNPKKLFFKYRSALIILASILLITFFVENPISQINKFNFTGVKEKLFKSDQTQKTNQIQQEKSQETKNYRYGGIKITDSSKIRFYVWEGAIEAWKNNPIFGTGVETFAFAYYKYKPIEHNLTSEWDYLYNKAHNEYLNYLTTTGVFGLGTYLLMIGWFLFIAFKKLNSKFEYRNSKQYQNLNDKNSKHFENSDFGFRILSIALLSGYVSILITNFFGFSVVIVSLYFFLIPAFVLTLSNQINSEKQFFFPKTKGLSNLKMENNLWVLLAINILFFSYLLFNLIKFWSADVDYAMGYNLDKSGQIQNAYPYLISAVAKRGDEPMFKDELFLNSSILIPAYAKQKDSAANINTLLEEAIKMDDEIILEHPNNVVFWKTRVRGFYSLSQINPSYLNFALSAIEKAHTLAPTDAKIAYNLGIVYGQTGNTEKAIAALEKAIKLKPDYQEVYYALGAFYHEAAIDKSGRIIKPELQKKAVATMKFVLENIADDERAKEALKNWGENY